MLARKLDMAEKPQYNVKDVLYYGALALQRADIRTASLDARILLQHVLNITREQLLADDKLMLTSVQYYAYQDLLEQRLERKPVSQLVGRREFWGLAFEVTDATLDPRPDSETLVEAALLKSRNRKKALRILDLGTGTGCLLLALLTEYPNATGIGVDISDKALQVARSNAKSLGLEDRAVFIQSRWCDKMQHLSPEVYKAAESAGKRAEKFDMVVSNPPYIPAGDIALLEPEVSIHEPRLALDGGKDGLDCYREIMPQLPHVLAADGFAVLEIGEGQQQEVSAIALASGMRVADIRYDLGGIARCLVISKKQE